MDKIPLFKPLYLELSLNGVLIWDREKREKDEQLGFGNYELWVYFN